MSLRRTGFAFAVTFVCALVVFTLPRLAWNTVQAATGGGAQRPDSGVLVPVPTAQASAQAVAPEAPPAEPRSIPARLVGLFGILAILGIGVLLSSNRRAIRWQVVAWGV